MNEVTIMAVIAINTLMSKLYSKLAHIDLSAGVSISYADGCIIASINGNSHYLAQTDTPDAWCLDGRRNWRALKRLCEAVDQGRTLTIQELGKSLQRKPVAAPEPIQLAEQVEAVTIEPAAILGFPDDWQKVIPEGLMTREERKEALADAPKRKAAPEAAKTFTADKKAIRAELLKADVRDWAKVLESVGTDDPMKLGMYQMAFDSLTAKEWAQKKGQPVAESALDGQSSDCDGGPSVGGSIFIGLSILITADWRFH
ncbi:hypothetical protein Ahp2_44 [Aeromonas phage Ahp2]|nr:hypothetical protein Ahp2_44 [Aeromonas phage Ahp2]